MTKRQKFIFTSLFLSAGLLLLQFSSVEWRYGVIGILTVLAIMLTLWSLYEALSGLRFFTTIILPALFTLGVGLFYFLLPQRFLTSLSIAFGFAIGMYALLLTENIFSVAAIRTIQLFRAAQAVGFLLTLLISFLLFDTIFSFRLSPWTNAGLVALVSLPLFFQGLWSATLEEKLSRRLLVFTLSLTLIPTELGFIISFWPTSVALSSLFLTTTFYVTLGLSHAHLQERLFRQTVYEYLGVGAVVLLIILWTTQWGG